MALKQKPSVGRIVHYHDGINPEPQAAIVVAVRPRDEVDLHVFHPDMGEYRETRVPHEDDAKYDYHWNYPPRVAAPKE